MKLIDILIVILYLLFHLNKIKVYLLQFFLEILILPIKPYLKVSYLFLV